MNSVKTIGTMIERLGFISAAATYLMSICGINSLDEIAYLDGIDKKILKSRVSLMSSI
jgi:hypothetical protein